MIFRNIYKKPHCRYHQPSAPAPPCQQAFRQVPRLLNESPGFLEQVKKGYYCFPRYLELFSEYYPEYLPLYKDISYTSLVCDQLLMNSGFLIVE
ncbi:hypothetical protein E2C01_097017 [Portunus trituberculatus]|uniref:Uncharacterized protein n=1 Tax=Portunus trituberculatus TaxID=210409 RepID=A0A5B7KA05_PORTR|nr:hypothetical protein [Portunus trituberculatus]